MSPRSARTASRTSERAASGELVLEYKRDGAAHQAFFPDAAAVRAKLRMLLADHPHIRGVYAWQMGQEDPRVWQELRKALHKRSTAVDRPHTRRGRSRRRAQPGPPSSLCQLLGGTRTWSMTWMTPFDVSMSAVTTLASFTMTVPSSAIVMVSG